MTDLQQATLVDSVPNYRASIGSTPTTLNVVWLTSPPTLLPRRPTLSAATNEVVILKQIYIKYFEYNIFYLTSGCYRKGNDIWAEKSTKRHTKNKVGCLLLQPFHQSLKPPYIKPLGSSMNNLQLAELRAPLPK